MNHDCNGPEPVWRGARRPGARQSRERRTVGGARRLCHPGEATVEDGFRPQVRPPPPRSPCSASRLQVRSRAEREHPECDPPALLDHLPSSSPRACSKPLRHAENIWASTVRARIIAAARRTGVKSGLPEEIPRDRLRERTNTDAMQMFRDMTENDRNNHRPSLGPRRLGGRDVADGGEVAACNREGSASREQVHREDQESEVPSGRAVVPSRR